MAAPASQTQICNDALVELGDSARILSMSDGSPLARLFTDTWNQARDEVLADHPWNFAIGRDALAVSTDFDPATVSTQYAYAYELPSDCLRWLPWREDHEDYFAGEQEGRFILSNCEAPVYARFIRLVENVALWSPGFRGCMSAKLGAKTAWAITAKTSVVERMEALYERRLAAAKRQDGLATGDRRRRAEYRSSWLDARERTWTGR